jgi:hypothetical protein
METIAIISIITSVGTLLTVFSKTIKKSSCLGCLNCESRTPETSLQYIPPNPSPQLSQKPSPQIIRHDIMNEIAV